jgi:hypothetical protein
MKLTKIITSLILFIAVNSCSENVEYSAKNILKEAPHQLELDEGEKWIVDEGMMISIVEMENSVNDFEGNQISDFQTLSKSIKSNLSGLTSNCTMKGQSHDELHKWLLPFFDLNGELKEANDSDKSINIVKEMKYELFVFRVYFK